MRDLDTPEKHEKTKTNLLYNGCLFCYSVGLSSWEDFLMSCINPVDTR